MEKPLSISRIIKKDHRCFWLLVFLIFWCIVVSLLWLFQQSKPSLDPYERLLTPIFGVMSVAIAIAILVYVAIRTRRIANALNAGVEVTGRVTYVGPNSEDVWFVQFEYAYNAKTFEGTQTVGAEPFAKRFAEDRELVLLIDPQNPERSYIKDIYLQ